MDDVVSQEENWQRQLAACRAHQQLGSAKYARFV
jgi:hypothetical protein